MSRNATLIEGECGRLRAEGVVTCLPKTHPAALVPIMDGLLPPTTIACHVNHPLTSLWHETRLAFRMSPRQIQGESIHDSWDVLIQ